MWKSLNSSLSEDVQALIPGSWEYVLLCGEGAFADITKVMNLN